MQAYRSGQEDRLGALGLVLNAAVLWTTRYLDAAVDHLRALPLEEREHNVLGEQVSVMWLRAWYASSGWVRMRWRATPAWALTR